MTTKEFLILILFIHISLELGSILTHMIQLGKACTGHVYKRMFAIDDGIRQGYYRKVAGPKTPTER